MGSGVGHRFAKECVLLLFHERRVEEAVPLSKVKIILNLYGNFFNVPFLRQ